MSTTDYRDLLDNNRAWVEEKLADDPAFFEALASGQRPPYLFIGCSDSRKPLNTITRSDPGELFIHRNVANQVPPDDVNVGAVLEYGVGTLGVRHVIVCGHTRCGGVEAAILGMADGVVGEWITPLRALYEEHREHVDGADDMVGRVERLARLNAVAQVRNVARQPAVARAMSEGKDLTLHGWLFHVETGIIEELELPADLNSPRPTPS